MKSILYTSLLLLLVISAFGQDEQQQKSKRIKFYGVSAGIDWLICGDPNTEFIRQDVSGYNYYYSNYGSGGSSLNSLFKKEYVGVTGEIHSIDKRFGFLGGLHYQVTHGTLQSASSFFYFLGNEQGTTTEYLKVKELRQSTSYIGVPLSIRLYTHIRRITVFYLSVGGDFSYRLNSTTEVDFVNSAMNAYSSDVLNKITAPPAFSSMIYFGVGFIGGTNPVVSLDMRPMVVLSSVSTGLVKPVGGFGFQLNILLPSKDNIK